MSRFVYGVNPVLEALKAHPKDVVRVLVERGHEGRSSRGADRVAQAAADAGVRVEDVPHGDLAHRSRSGVHQGVGAELTQFRYAELEDVLSAIEGPAFLLVLDGVTDPQNLGAIVRSAEVLGAGALVLPRDRSAPVTPAVIRASAGATAHLPIVQVVNLTRALGEMKQRGYWIVGLAPAGSSEFQELPALERAVLVVGSEDKGARPLVRETCDFLVRIPQRGRVESLNASVAAAIGIYGLRERLVRASKPPGSGGPATPASS